MMHAPTPMTSEEIFIEVDGAKGTSSRRWEWIKAWTFKIPSYFWIAFIVLAVLETLAIVGSYYYIKGQTSSNRDASLNVARVSARAMERLLEAQEAPVREMADMIAMNPHYPTASSKFETLATLIAKSYDFYEIEIAPLGYVSDMYLPWLTLTGDDLLNWKLDNFDYQTNILWPAPLRRSYWPPVTADFPTIVYQNNSIFLAGPFFGDGILTDGALISRVSVFLPDDGNWSFPSETANSVCPPELCNAPDGRKFWGFVNCVFPYVFIAQGLQAVKDAGLQYSVNADYVQVDSGYPTFLDASRNFTSSDDYVCTSVAIYGWLSWSLCVSQSGGWAPVWAPALYAGVTVLSVLISVLVFFILRSRKKAVEFLEKQVEWNKELETEKEKLQAMMVRQFELIDCFTTRPTSSSLGNNIEDKIKAAREQLTASGVDKMAEADKIVLFNLLGQGSFGAVYLGEWRGTAVAVKRIVLPAAMSASSRAEKMAIMEVAISSSMSHPHLVQTYTYRVKPLEENFNSMSNAIVLMSADGSTVRPSYSKTSAGAASDIPSPSLSAVTSYELLLVLEYCDKGSLRSLLDIRGLDDANGCLNYPVALAICLDIAKAMIHLHRNNIMHLDLKAANVLLKTGSSGENSLIAKVMDFGLSLSLDVETHVSSLVAGTTSHMSPEILMEGKQTKQADVYAFGITLWEIFTCQKAYKGIPQMVLGHKIVFEHLRPAFPANTPADFKLLAERCWHPDPKERPDFDEIFTRLKEMRDQFSSELKPLRRMDTNAPAAPSYGGDGAVSVAKFAPPMRQNETEASNSVVAESQVAGYLKTQGA